MSPYVSMSACKHVQVVTPNGQHMQSICNLDPSATEYALKYLELINEFCISIYVGMISYVSTDLHAPPCPRDSHTLSPCQILRGEIRDETGETDSRISLNIALPHVAFALFRTTLRASHPAMRMFLNRTQSPPGR